MLRCKTHCAQIITFYDNNTISLGHVYGDFIRASNTFYQLLETMVVGFVDHSYAWRYHTAMIPLLLGKILRLKLSWRLKQY